MSQKHHINHMSMLSATSICDDNKDGDSSHQPSSLLFDTAIAEAEAEAGGAGAVAGSSAAHSDVSSTNNSFLRICDEIINPKRETCTIQSLRAVVLVLLLVTATASCSVIFLLTRNDESREFEINYRATARRIQDQVHHAITQRLAASHALAVDLTSYSISHQRSFPFVTLPNFAQRGSALRVAADSMVVHWVPMVKNEDRAKWEEYALENRFHIDEAFEEDAKLRQYQDEVAFPKQEEHERHHHHHRSLANSSSRNEQGNLTVLGDGTGFHPHIYWGQDEPEDSAPYYFPLWQRSPINAAKQRPLNMNDAKTPSSKKVLPVLLKTQKAILNHATLIPPINRERFKKNVALSQFRRNIPEVLDDPITYLYYPVFNNFDNENRQIVGVLETNIFWKLLFNNLLQQSDRPVLCVLSNSFNQTLSYRIRGLDVAYLGLVDAHDKAAEPYLTETNLNAFVQSQASPRNRAYQAAPLATDYGTYQLRIYPADFGSGIPYSNRPWMYTFLFAALSLFTALLYVVFTILVERRRRIITEATIEQAKRAANTERSINEFVAHEVRNPLSAAISATSFVKSTILEATDKIPKSLRESLMDDIEIVTTSLHFINDFLRSIIDTHRAEKKMLQVNLAPTDILRDVLEPAKSMLYKPDTATGVQLDIECHPENLIVATDSLRLKQIVINLLRNSFKFVEKGFVRVKARGFEDQQGIEIVVEDSGPGVPEYKRDKLFQKYQTSLDSLAQGTGLGLNLCKNLMLLLKGDIWLDTSYDSGVEGRPGARFVLQLNSPPLRLEQLDLSQENDPVPLSGTSNHQSTAGTSSKEGAKELLESMEEGNSITNGNGNAMTTADQNGSHDEEPIQPVMVEPSDTATATAVDLVSSCPPRTKNNLPTTLSVLFVDDDMLIRKLFTRAVRKYFPAWNIDEAASGETSLTMVQSKQYDLIFMDQYMRSTGQSLLGTETVRELRANGVTSIICGLSANDMECAFVSAGANAFVLKPFPCREEEMKQVLSRVLAG